MADRIPERYRATWTQDRPIDIRPVEPIDPFRPEVRPPRRLLWLRADGVLPEEPLLHQAVLAYASDYSLLTAALLPHGVSMRAPGLQLASLDHSLWLHRPFRADEWLLYVIDSPVSHGARGFARGAVYTQRGELVATVAQEGLIRLRPTDPTPP
jgi:acyl-CoA thioesterase-2